MLEQIELRENELRDHVKQLMEEKDNLRQAQERERELETKLSNARRMESLGLLAGGVAHDLNNLLGPVLAYPDIILSQLAPEDPISEDLFEIKSAAIKSAAIIQDLLTLARRGSFHSDILSLNTVIDAFLNSPAFKNRMQTLANISIHKEVEETLPTIIGSAHHLTQVVMNICLNGMESMKEGGQLSIQTFSQTLTVPRSVRYGEVEPGSYVVLKVRDEGEGIPSDLMDHIFEPFFTRKKLGLSGTGLGLSVVYGITQDLGGTIDLESKEGQGSSFTIYFPATDLPLKATPESNLPEGHNERILVVDDVEAQRKLATRLLKQLGYRVAQAESGQAALDYIQREHVDLVLLDMIMDPGWNGLETYLHLIKVRPHLRCVICSGYADQESMEEADALGLQDRIMKPYTVEKLSVTVREVLDRPDEKINA